MEKRADSDVVIGDVYHLHPEVFHYTTGQGLFGILNDGQLWATYRGALNDTTEMEVARSFFVEKFGEIGLEMAAKKGSVLAANAAERAVEGAYNTAFGWDASIGQPFVTSFCGTPDDEYQYVNGLLNMWQAYGEGGGYALKFDTKVIHEMAGEYFSRASAFATFGPVCYSEESRQWAAYQRMIASCSRSLFTAILEYQETGRPECITFLGLDVWKSFVQTCMHIKHRAFAIEKEVRLCILRQPEAEKGQSVLPIHYRPGASGPVPFLKLFDDKRLLGALKTIIVGPHPQAEKRMEFVEFFRNANRLKFEIIKSDIPYLPKV